MKEFFIKAVFFLGINLCILTLLIILGRLTEKRLEYDPGDTESSLLAMRKGAEYGFVLLGTSHGRVFSRGSKQPAVEKLLDKSEMGDLAYRVERGAEHLWANRAHQAP